MAVLKVRGGNPLTGTVPALGAKNAALPLLAAALLVEDGKSELVHVPDLSDVAVMIQILVSLGADVAMRPDVGGQVRLEVDACRRLESEVPPELMARMRSSVFLLGPLLGRVGRARLTHPGGCDIGARPIDLHLRGLARLGTRIEERDGLIEAVAPPGGLVGGDVYLDLPSVGATENILMAAVRARGETIIRNAAREPEIVDLAAFLTACGALIEGAGESVVRIRGVNCLAGVRHRVMPDRIETGTLLLAGAATGGEVQIDGAASHHLGALIDVLRASDATVEITQGAICVRGPQAGRPRPVDVRTLPYPGFPTDLQPVLMAYLARANGTSVLQETIFENRFRHASAFVRMAARVRVVGRTAVIDGVSRLTGAVVEGGDLRASAALVVAALAAEGVSKVAGMDHLERGYQDLAGRLRRLGADVRPCEDAAPSLNTSEARVS